MLKHLKLIAFLLLMPLGLMSCISDDEPDNKKEVITTLTGTRWSSNNWNYYIGDDYVTINEDGREYIFYSSTQGALYEWFKEYDSDYGNGHLRKLSFFDYECSGSEVSLNFIVPTNQSGKKLYLENGVLSEPNGISYSKIDLDANTKTWLSDKHGTTGSCDWYYDLMSKIVISGNGKMADYSSWNATPWSKLTKYHAINKVETVGGVQNVGNYAFSYKSIAEASLSNKTESIGIGAFAGSTLGSIWIPASVKEIKNDAFSDCKYLNNVSCMYNVETIGDCAFSNCKSISLILCDKIQYIGKMAFSGCKVKSFTRSEDLVSIETGAFSDCDFTSLKLPNSLQYLGHCAFSSTKISSIQVGTGLTSVSGTPFIVSSSGTIYVDKNTPIAISDDFVDAANKWTLRVPNGSKNAYSNALYWKNFKSIKEDSSLAGDGTTPEDPGDDPEEDPSTYKGTLNGHDWVDLGLSVKWATLNIGASDINNPGDYFNWNRSATNWETDAYGDVGEDWSGKYSDAITELWGKGWRTPYKSDFEELINNCTFSQVKENGVTCIKVVSKINSQYILIPLSGRMEGIRDYGSSQDELNLFGKAGFLWTASSDAEKNIAYYFAVEISSTVKTSIGYRYICQYIYSSYSKIPMRGVCN